MLRRRIKNIDEPLGSHSLKKAQTAVEYMLLFAVVVSIVLIGFKNFIPRVRDAGNVYFKRTGKALLGKPNPCGDGRCDSPREDGNSCCKDCPPGCGGWDYSYSP